MSSILNLAGQQLDIVVIAGDSVRVQLQLEYQDGTSLELTGYTMAAQVREKHGAASPISFDVTMDGATAVLYLPPGATAELLPYNVWDFQLTSQDGADVRTLVSGAFRVKSEVTK